MKLLPAVRREKVRYLVFEIINQNSKRIKLNYVLEEINKLIYNYLGIYGMSLARPYFFQELYDENKKRGILKVNRKYLNHLRTALLLVKKIRDEDLIIRTIVVTGTLKRAKEFLKN